MCILGKKRQREPADGVASGTAGASAAKSAVQAEARPILTRLRRDFGHVLGLSVGAFAETSQELRRLLGEVAILAPRPTSRRRRRPCTAACRPGSAAERRAGCCAAVLVLRPACVCLRRLFTPQCASACVSCCVGAAACSRVCPPCV